MASIRDTINSKFVQQIFKIDMLKRGVTGIAKTSLHLKTPVNHQVTMILYVHISSRRRLARSTV